MKKIYYLLWVLILTGCSKKSGVSPTITNATITYSLTYIIPTSSTDTTVQFTGNTWSKIYTITDEASYSNGKVLPLYIESSAELAGQILTLTISVNNQLKATNSSTSVDPNVTTDYNYQVN